MQTQSNRRRIIPEHNLFGDHGPRCYWCSGLGRVLQLGERGYPTKSTSQCSCKGTGIDQAWVEGQRFESLLSRIDALELKWAKEHQKRQAIEIQLAKLKARSPKMSRQFWMEQIAWATASGATVSTAAVETILMPNVTIPANYMQDGRCLRLKAFGQWTTTASTPTHIFAFRWGGVAGTMLCKTAAITTVASITAAGWDVDVEIVTRSNGSGGTLMANGSCRMYAGVATTIASATGNAATTPMMSGGTITPAVATCDLTADTALALTGIGSTTALTLIGLQYTIESKN